MTTEQRKKTEAETRGHEHVLDIPATPEAVWRAITEPAELVRWFPLGAETTPGAGGEIVYRWGALEGRCRILAWRPPSHLRTTWMEAPSTSKELNASPDARGAAAVVVDWFLDAAGGGTRLRVVHSGFGRDAAWDKEYDGTDRGWEFELRALQHYLARHRGKERRATWLRREVSASPADVWRRFSRPGALFREVDLDALRPGDRFRLVRADGEALEGRVLVLRAPLEFAGTLESHGGAMLRFGLEDCMGAPEAHVWYATWSRDEAGFREDERRWREALERAFG